MRGAVKYWIVDGTAQRVRVMEAHVDKNIEGRLSSKKNIESVFVPDEGTFVPKCVALLEYPIKNICVLIPLDV